MRRMMKSLLGILCCACLVGAAGFPAFAEAKASEGASGILAYQAENLSWNGEEVTVKGQFVNTSADKDITQINSATFSVFDASDKKITETTLNSSSLGEVKLAPGERWSYTIVRTVPGFNPGNFELDSSFKTGCSTDITIGSHGSGCSFCASRGSLAFSTEDTMSQEEWENLIAKLRKAVGNDSSSAQASSGTGSAGTYVPYTPYVPSTSGINTKRTCITCNGTGYLICENCNGMGYNMPERRMTCLVSHHADCPGIHGGSCNDCHERHDIRPVKEKCYQCGSDGRKTCPRCFGSGTR